jgi:hypothetical protein
MRFSLEGGPSVWGTAPPAYYLLFLWRSLGPLLACALGVFGLAGLRRAPALGLAVAAFIAAHSVVPHKESRFLLPALAPLCALAAIGLSEVAARAASRSAPIAWAAAAVVLIGAAISATWFHSMTWKQIGGARSYPANELAYEYDGNFNRLLLAAHDQKDLCGLLFENFPRFSTGGYTYLHRRVPILTSPLVGRTTTAANYAITSHPAGGAAAVVARSGRWSLVRFAAGCPTPKPPSDRLTDRGARDGGEHAAPA